VDVRSAQEIASWRRWISGVAERYAFDSTLGEPTVSIGECLDAAECARREWFDDTSGFDEPPDQEPLQFVERASWLVGVDCPTE